MRNVLLAASVVVGLALGVGWSQLSSRESGPEEARDAAGATAVLAPAVPLALDAPQLATVTPTEIDAPPATSDTDLAALLASFPVRTYERGEGVITGTVAQRDGTPVAGVRVTAIVWGTTPGVDYREPDQTDLQSYILQEIDQYHFDRALLSSAVTDEAGRFSIDGIHADRDYHLNPALKDWVFNAQSARHITAGQTAALTAFPSAPITIDVQREDGAREMYGTLVVSRQANNIGAGGSLSWAWDRRNPTLSLPVDFPLVSYTAMDGTQSAAVEANLAHGVPAQLSLTVPRSLAIRGTVEGTQGFPFYLTCVSLEPGETALDQRGLGERESSTDVARAGRFAFGGLEPGRYQVILSGLGNGMADSQVVDLTSAPVDIVLSAPPVDPAQYLIVRALTPDGRPATGVQFQFSVGFEDSGSGRISHDSEWDPATIAKEPGVYWLGTGDGYEEYISFSSGGESLKSSVKPAHFELTCTSPEHGATRVTVRPETRQVEVQFSEAATVEVEVTGIEDWRLRNLLTVSLEGHRGADYQLIGTRNSISLGAVAPGECTVVLSIRSRFRWWNTQPLVSTQIQASPGPNLVRIACPPLYRVVFEMPPEQRGTAVSLYSISSESRESGPLYSREPLYSSEMYSTVGADGRLLFSYVPAGHYQLDEMRVDITGNATIPYRVAGFVGMEVTIWDPDGRLVTWGLQTGDCITAINGLPLDFDDRARLNTAIRSLTQPGAIAITVVRNGGPLTLQIENPEAVSLNALGGELTPMRGL